MKNSKRLLLVVIAVAIILLAVCLPVSADTIGGDGSLSDSNINAELTASYVCKYNNDASNGYGKGSGGATYSGKDSIVCTAKGYYYSWFLGTTKYNVSTTLTLTNSTEGTKTVSFILTEDNLHTNATYTVKKNGTDALTPDSNRKYSVNLDKGETCVIYLKSETPSANNSATLNQITISEILLEVQEASVTFFPGEHGKVFFGEKELTTSEAIKYTKNSDMTVVADEGYEFAAWMYYENGDINHKVYTTDANFLPTGTVTIAPVFVPTDSPTFQVGDETYYYWEDAFDDAKSSGDTVVLVGDGKLHQDEKYVKEGDYVTIDENTGVVTYEVPSGTKFVVPCADNDMGTFGHPTTSYFGMSARVSTGNDDVTRYLAPIYNAPPQNLTFKTAKYTGSNYTESFQTLTYSRPHKTLTIPHGVKLVVNGQMNVNSYVHASDAVEFSLPHGPYGWVRLEENGTIDVNGQLYCYGFISGVYEDGIYSTGQVKANSGASVYEVFQIRDWRFAGVAEEFYKNNYQNFIFSQYYIQNIEVDLVLKAGAKSYATFSWERDYLGLQQQNLALLMVGASTETETALFNMTAGVLTRTYNPYTEVVEYSFTKGSDERGQVSLDRIAMELSTGSLAMDIDSANYILGLNNHISINIGEDCDAVVSTRIKMLPGSRINVAKGGTLTVAESGALYVYDSEAFHTNYVRPGYTSLTISGTAGAVLDNRNTNSTVVRYSAARAAINGADTAVTGVTFGSANLNVDGQLIGYSNIFAATAKVYYTKDSSGNFIINYAGVADNTDSVLTGTGTFTNNGEYTTSPRNDETHDGYGPYGELEEYHHYATSDRFRVYIPCVPVLGFINDGTAPEYTWGKDATYAGYYDDTDTPRWTTNTVTIILVDGSGNELSKQGQYFAAGSDLTGYHTDAALGTKCDISSYDGTTVLTLYALAPAMLESGSTTTYYTTLHAAVLKAVNAGDKITLLADVKVTSPVEIAVGQDIIIDLNGKTITYNSTVFKNYGKLTLNFNGATVINDSHYYTCVSAIKNYGTLPDLNIGAGTLKWTAPKSFIINSSFAPLYNYKGATASVTMGGGQIEVGYVVSVKVDQASYRVSAVFNLGNLELNKSQEGEEINRTGIVSSNVVGVKDAFFSSDGLVFTGAATVYNGGTMHIANVTINGNGSDPGHTNSACIYNRYDATMSIDNIKTYLFKGYAIINGGGTISSIIDANLQTSYYGILNFNTAVLREDGQYEAGYKGRIETITNLNITARSAFAIQNKGYIGTIDGSSYIKGGGGNPRTIINYSTGAYNYVSAQAEDMPTIKKIAGTTQIEGGSSSSSTINNQGNILEISGSAKITCSTVQHAITMGEGGYIGTISGSVTIESTGGYGIYVGGTKADGLSGIGSITGGTISGAANGIYLDGKIGTISGGTTKSTSTTAGAAIYMATANANITTISGTATISGAYDGILMVAGANIGSINGTTVSITGTASYGIYVPTGATVGSLQGIATISGKTAIYLGSGVNLDIGNASSNITANGTDFGVHMAGATSGTINATISGDTAIKLENGASATTISGKVTGTAYGVYVDSATVGTISAETSGDTAVYLANTTANTSISGKVTGGAYGIHSIGVPVSVTGETSATSGEGIYLLDCTTESSIVCNVTGTTVGVHLSGAKVSTINGIVSGDTAIKLESGASATTISGKADGTTYGVYADGATVGTISAETDGDTAVYLANTTTKTSISGKVTGSSYGVHADNAVFEVTSNAEVDGLTGIYLVNCTTENNIYGTIHGADYGIHVDGCKIGTINATVNNTSTLAQTAETASAIYLSSGSTAVSIHGDIDGTTNGIYIDGATVTSISGDINGKTAIILTNGALVYTISGTIKGYEFGITLTDSTIDLITGNGTYIEAISDTTNAYALNVGSGALINGIGGNDCTISFNADSSADKKYGYGIRVINGGEISNIGTGNDTINITSDSTAISITYSGKVGVIGASGSKVNITSTSSSGSGINMSSSAELGTIGGEKSTVIIEAGKYGVIAKTNCIIDTIGGTNSTVYITCTSTSRGDGIYVYVSSVLNTIGAEGSTVICNAIRPIYLTSGTIHYIGCAKNSRVELLGTGVGIHCHDSTALISELGKGLVVINKHTATGATGYYNYALYVYKGTINLISGGYYYSEVGGRGYAIYLPDGQNYAQCHSLSTDTKTVTVSTWDATAGKYVDTEYACFYVTANHTWSDDCVCDECSIFRFYATNVKLGNNLDILFAFPKTTFMDTTKDYSGYYVEFTRPGMDPVKVYFKDWQTMNISGTDYFVVTYSGFAAKEMCDEVTVIIYDSNNKEVSVSKTDSIQAYALRMLKKHTDNKFLQAAIVDMLTYGAACQEYFAAKENITLAPEALANYGLEQYYMDSDGNAIAYFPVGDELMTYAEYVAREISVTRNTPTASVWFGANLIAESNIQFAVAVKDPGNDITITQVEYAFTGHKNNTESGTVMRSAMVPDNGYYYFYIPKIVVADARQTISFTAHLSDGTTVEWTDSIQDYVGRNQNNSSVFLAFMKFADSAHAYLHSGEVV